MSRQLSNTCFICKCILSMICSHCVVTEVVKNKIARLVYNIILGVLYSVFQVRVDVWNCPLKAFTVVKIKLPVKAQRCIEFTMCSKWSHKFPDPSTSLNKQLQDVFVCLLMSGYCSQKITANVSLSLIAAAVED